MSIGCIGRWEALLNMAARGLRSASQNEAGDVVLRLRVRRGQRQALAFTRYIENQ